MPTDLSAALQPPILTADLPGIGGRIKASPDDFVVEEIPAYEPSGSGEFLFLWLEKRDMGAEFFARQVAHRLDITVSEVGVAGLKDRHAVSRQWVSVPASAEANLARLEGDGIRVLSVSRHGNKLRAGHLRGNRFKIVVRELAQGEDVGKTVGAVVQRIREQGLPNFYGSQRFGHDGETLQLGLALIHNQPMQVGADGRRPNLRNKFLRKLALSAVQSALFNQYLAVRMADGLLGRVLPGDVMAKWPFGGMFVATDVAGEQARADRREIVSAGPIFGRKTFPAKEVAAERESAVLANAGLSAQSFAHFGKLLQGTRRHNVVYIDDLAADVQLACVQLTLTLPAGCYATVLLQEVMKAQSPPDDEGRDP